MRSWPYYMVAALLAASACARMLGLDGAKSRPFEHRAHVLEGIACVTCHVGVPESGRDAPLHLPDSQRCLGCHPTTHDAAMRARSCMECHGQPYTSHDLMQARQHLLFEHRKHEQASSGQCVRCHQGVTRDAEVLRPPMAVCLGCHQHKDQFKSRDCDSCHVDIRRDLPVPTSHIPHDRGFVERHGDAASSASDLCDSCHRQAFCTGCHGADVPLLPGESAFDDPMVASVHRAGFRSRHGQQARVEPELCTGCHAPDSCFDCHLALGVSGTVETARSPHPAGWVGVTQNDHGRAARRDPIGCASCHSGAGEMLCVECHQVGGIGGSVHPPGWSSEKSLVESPCRLCHPIGLMQAPGMPVPGPRSFLPMRHSRPDRPVPRGF